jgi:uncharacterized membrane protein
MIRIPLHAKVECTDGPVGHSTAVIVNPDTLQVTHFVVKEKASPQTERLVSVELVEETTPDLIRLNCTRDELAKLEEFIIRTFRRVTVPRYYGEMNPLYAPEIETLPVEEERVPFGEIAIHKGIKVHATDGEVGEADELLVDATSGQITHFVLREKKLWGDRGVIVPIGLVDHSDREGAHLEIDKQTVASMLAVPIASLQDITGVQLVIVTFPETGIAQEALDKMATKDRGDFLNAAVLVKDKDGQTSTEEVQDVGKRHGAVFGALTGGLIGMLAGPGGGIVGAITGAATARAAAKRIDMGFPDEYLKKLQEGLQPSSSALVVLVERERVAAVQESVAGFGGQFLQQELTEEIVEQLTTEGE